MSVSRRSAGTSARILRHCAIAPDIEDAVRWLAVVATATLSDAKGEPLKIKSKQVLHPIPGSLHAVSCVAKAEVYAASESVFEEVFASFVPKGADIVAQAPANGPSVLTLYSGQRFDGVARVGPLHGAARQRTRERG